MLRCHFQILGPFTKKPTVLRWHSVLRTPFGCSIHKKGIFLHLGNQKEWDQFEKNYKLNYLKNQKNFIWTSLFFYKDQKNSDKSTEFNISSEKETEGKKNLENKENVFLKSNIIVLENDAVNSLKSNKNDVRNLSNNILSDSTKSSSNTESSSKDANLLQTELKTIQDTSSDTMKAFESNNEILNNSNNQSSNNATINNIEKYVLDTVSLSKKSNVDAYVRDSTGSNVYDLANSKKYLSQASCSNNQVNQSSNIKKDNEKPIDLSKRKENEHKRQVVHLNLGEISQNISLVPPETAPKEKDRLVDQIKPLKDTPQFLLEKAKVILRKTASLKQNDTSRNVKIINLGTPKPDTSLNVATRRRQTVDLNKCSTERNFITPVRAMTDFLLKPSDLEGLRKTKRRSPYENDPPITVYWRKDVEAKALDVWGSKENLLKEILKRDIERRRYQQNLFTVKRRLRDYRREQGRETEVKVEQDGLFGSSGRVVLTAIAVNGTNFLFKLLAWCYTGSHSMFSEAVHSLADTVNQLILAYGIHKSVQRADSDHPYGYTNMRYVASLISGVGIFCVGSGLSFYHGVIGLTNPSDLPSFYWAFFILGGSLASEGATLIVAFNSIRLGVRKYGMSFTEYVLRGQDPSVNVVLLEDTASVIGVGFAATCMGLSIFYNSHIPDAIGSFLVGGLLAGVASFIIYTNVAALVGRSIPQERLDKINAELESDVMIRAIHDVKGIDIGNSLVRYKAEMDFDGGELTRSYLDKQDLNLMLEEVKKMQTIDDLEEFMLKHGENIVDMMGGEIDRIELKLRKKHPEIRHCDLEIL